MNKLRIYAFLFILNIGCSHQNELELSCIKEGKVYKEKIEVDTYISKENRIRTKYIDSLSFSIVDSISFQHGNPDKMTDYSTSIELNFTERIKQYSSEYYALATAHFITKSINYYNSLFDGKIDFDKEEEYRNITSQFGGMVILTNPKRFIYEKGSLISPSVLYHEVGHRAFWFLDDFYGINFDGLTYIHMGLLEYFTVSLNNSPIVGECVLPSKLVRDVTLPYNYPFNDSLNVAYSFQLLKKSYAEDLKDSTKCISRYINLSLETYGDKLSGIYDNHRTALIVTSTLWRIREKLGQENTDKLVAQTILNLNKYQEEREFFYKADKDEILSKKIDWFDLLHGLIQKDLELFGGKNSELIKNEFKQTGFSVEKIKSIIV